MGNKRYILLLPLLAILTGCFGAPVASTVAPNARVAQVAMVEAAIPPVPFVAPEAPPVFAPPPPPVLSYMEPVEPVAAIAPPVEEPSTATPLPSVDELKYTVHVSISTVESTRSLYDEDLVECFKDLIGIDITVVYDLDREPGYEEVEAYELEGFGDKPIGCAETAFFISEEIEYEG